MAENRIAEIGHKCAEAENDGPVVRSTLTRFADTVDAMIFGITVGGTHD